MFASKTPPALQQQRPLCTGRLLPRSMAKGGSSNASGLRVLVRPVSTPKQLEHFREMTRAYLEWLGEDLGFQGIERELASLPGSYAAQARGAMLLAYECSNSSSSSSSSADAAAGNTSDGVEELQEEGECIGAVALRALQGHTATVAPGQEVALGVALQDVCEMKRLFVVPGHHGRGAGAALVRELLTQAHALGYQAMVLDTLERLAGANRLYSRLGFEPCPRYNDCPLPGVLYFARALGGLQQLQQQQLEPQQSAEESEFDAR